MEAHDRLKQARLDAGFRTATEAARILRVKVPTYLGHENGSRKFDTGYAKLYARHFKVSSGWLLTGEQLAGHGENGAVSRTSETGIVNITTTPGLRVLGEVAAGVWLEVDPISQYDEPLFEVPVPEDSRFPKGAVYGLLVRGTSLNKIADDGDILVCLDRASAGFDIADDDLVIVERVRAQDGLREVSAKRARRINGHKLELWPESTDPRFQDPISTSVVGDDHIRIIARVEWIFKDVRSQRRR